MSKKITKAKARQAQQLLETIADALTKLDELDAQARLKHGALYTTIGYVLPVDDGPWVARTLLYTELIPDTINDDD